MSVLMTMRMKADADKVENQDRSTLTAVMDKAKQHGLISHHFYAQDDEVMIVDEWPDQASFERFFASAPEIRDIMASADAQPPEVTFWRHLNTGDDYPD